MIENRWTNVYEIFSRHSIKYINAILQNVQNEK